jgi:hypothetical protein
MHPLNVIAPEQLDSPVDPGLFNGHRQFLAEGDSWFSISTFTPRPVPNLLVGMQFNHMNTALNFATPGETIRLMVDWRRNPGFLSWLCGNKATRWSGILLSAGGHDLLEALKVMPQIGGVPVPLDRRLMRAPVEWGAASEGALRYFSEPGWSTFEHYLRTNFSELIAMRDRNENRNTPTFLHGYGLAPLKFDRFGIPPADWPGLSALLFGRLGALLASIAASHPQVHFFDSIAVPLDPSDWRDMTHLSDSGHRKVGAAWAQVIEAVVG